MASLEECHAALERLSERIAGVDESERRQHAFDRTLSCHVPDLAVTFSGAMSDGHIRDITTDPAPKAQIRLTANSDDLVALTDGHLDLAKAWLSGRLKIDAGVRDMLKLRSMF
ncbi:MAG: SCP2 sterol-binding domain-containing protein [Actinomycetes bacterium]